MNGVVCVQNFTLTWPTKLHFGCGTLPLVPDLLRSLGAKRPLVMVGMGAMKRAGYLSRLEELLQGWPVAFHTGIAPNPTVQDLAAAVAAIGSEQPDCIIAMGGGSVVDVAKSARVVAQLDAARLERWLGGELLPDGRYPPCVAIPTTAGTASELTPWATIWRPERGQKTSLEGRCLVPEFAVIDPELTLSLPADQSVSCGLDALSHAIESYWAPRSQPCSRALSLEAVRLVLRSLPRVAREPRNLGAREDISWACTLAGLSFSQTKTTAAHALSYPLTLRFGIWHGIACALFLPAVLEFNAESDSAPYQPLFAAIGACVAREAAATLRHFYETLSVSPRLSSHGVTRECFETIAAAAIASPRSLNNPRPLSLADAMTILEATA